MKTVVLDTNVLLDLFVFNDFRAFHLKQALLDQQIDVLASPKTLEELADVISRPLFCLDKTEQDRISFQWQSIARVLGDENLLAAPWQCQDPDDQVFLDLAFTSKPCLLISKDHKVLKLASKGAKESIRITSDYSAIGE